ncbi:MAG: type III pantothenate kinase [Flavobacteriaceae bacterium]|nr:type III pantothenate kinase [Flavobacteriaceae bacterium]
MNLIIDVGNTRVKIAVFEKDTLLKLDVIEENELLKKVDFLVSEYQIKSGIIASVRKLPAHLERELLKKTAFLVLNHTTKVPFINQYKTPKTLGVDRIALVANAAKKYTMQHVLIIDAGTCITFDFVNSKGMYLGGAISPGITMRYNAVKAFTSKLPLLEKKSAVKLTGTTTEESIHSGIINGILNEIEGVISQYKKEYPLLTIVLTGGDTYFLAKQLKSGIFAHPNFVLEGLNTILIHNKEEC